MERLVTVWCPSLSVEGERGEEVRAFDRVLGAVGELCPWVEPVRLGVCTLPARGPSRFFGGEGAVVARVSAAAAGALEVAADEPGAPGVGVADGLFAALLAARTGLVVPAGATAAFLAPWSVAALGRPELAVTLQRLGVTTLGHLADLPERHVLARFGGDAALCHRVARGETGELAGLRDPGVGRRLQAARGEVAAGPPQHGFFGGASAGDARAAAALARVRDRLGPEGVVVGRLTGGRGPAERGRLVPWGSVEAAAPASGPAPWPGRLPAPSPVTVPVPPVPAEVLDPDGRPVRVTAPGLLTAEPALVSVDGGRYEAVEGWAGPWPVTERWWAGWRRRARLQVVSAGAGRLLVAERGRWWVEACYE